MFLQGLARRKDDKRKKEREAYKARKAAEKAKKAEELRRLKNLKKDEIRKRLDKIKQISGGGMVRRLISFFSGVEVFLLLCVLVMLGWL